jgi:hypothetical protein
MQGAALFAGGAVLAGGTGWMVRPDDHSRQLARFDDLKLWRRPTEAGLQQNRSRYSSSLRDFVVAFAASAGPMVEGYSTEKWEDHTLDDGSPDMADLRGPPSEVRYAPAALRRGI